MVKSVFSVHTITKAKQINSQGGGSSSQVIWPVASWCSAATVRYSWCSVLLVMLAFYVLLTYLQIQSCLLFLARVIERSLWWLCITTGTVGWCSDAVAILWYSQS